MANGGRQVYEGIKPLSRTNKRNIKDLVDQRFKDKFRYNHYNDRMLVHDIYHGDEHKNIQTANDYYNNEEKLLRRVLRRRTSRRNENFFP